MMGQIQCLPLTQMKLGFPDPRCIGNHAVSEARNTQVVPPEKMGDSIRTWKRKVRETNKEDEKVGHTPGSDSKRKQPEAATLIPIA